MVGLRTELGDNLYACCLYGSAVRGNSVEGVSDLNLLIVLQESAPAAHAAIARVIGADPLIDPFILGRRGLARSARAFAPKFASIRRNYRVLYGADPLVDFQVDPALEKFLCEQALRNLRLRLIYSFVTRQRHKSYDRFLQRNITGLFVNFSEALRLHGVTVPVAFEARIPLFEQQFKVAGQCLRDLLAWKKAPPKLNEAEVVLWHERIFPVIDAVLTWMEANWEAK